MAKKNKLVLPITIALIIIVIGVIAGFNSRGTSFYDSKTSALSVSGFIDEGLVKVIDGGVIDNSYMSSLSFVDPLKDCDIKSKYRANYEEGVRLNGDIILHYGAGCGVGERIVMYACTGSSGNSGTCYRLFDDDYVKDYSADNINLNIECGKGVSDGITNCYDRSWYTERINNRYVGYNCLSCDDEVSDPSIALKSVVVSPKQVVVGEEFVITGTAKISGGSVHNAVIETGVDFYGKTMSLSIINLDSDAGACGDDSTVGVKFNADMGDTINFKLTDVSYKLGTFRVPVYAVKGCIGEIGVNNQVIYDREDIVIDVIEKPDMPEPEPDPNIPDIEPDPEEPGFDTLITCYWCVDGVMDYSDEIIGEECPVGTSSETLDCGGIIEQDTYPGNPDAILKEKELYEETWFMLLIAGVVIVLIVLGSIILKKK